MEQTKPTQNLEPTDIAEQLSDIFRYNPHSINNEYGGSIDNLLNAASNPQPSSELLANAYTDYFNRSIEVTTVASQELANNKEYIPLGIDNLLPELHALLSSKSLLSKVCRQFLSTTFNTKPIFGNATQENVKLAIAKLNAIGITDSFMVRLFNDVVLHGGIAPLLAFGPSADGKIIPKKAIFNNFRLCRLGLPKPVSTYMGAKAPMHIVYMESWEKKKSPTNAAIKYPIIGSSMDFYGLNNIALASQQVNTPYIEFDTKFIEENTPTAISQVLRKANTITGCFYGMQAHEVLKYYPLPLYHTTEALSEMWGSAEMAQVKQNIIGNGLFLHTIIVINRKKLEGRDGATGKSNERLRREAEVKKFDNKSGAKGSGSSIVIWNDRLSKTDLPPVTIEEVPTIKSHDFLALLDTLQASKIKMAFQIPNATFIGLDQVQASGWSNQAAKAYVDFVIMTGSVGTYIRRPIEDFLNYTLRALGFDESVRITGWEEPLLMQKLSANAGLDNKQKAEMASKYMGQEQANLTNPIQGETDLPD